MNFSVFQFLLLWAVFEKKIFYMGFIKAGGYKEQIRTKRVSPRQSISAYSQDVT